MHNKPLKTEYNHTVNKMMSIIASGRLPQAMIFLSADPLITDSLVHRIALHSLCTGQVNRPCEQCKSCYLMQHGTHPDLHYIKPEKEGARLKVDQIRHLHNFVYRQPQCALSKIIVIEQAHDMSASVSNALLKLLEEPPQCSHFILCAEKISTLIPTVRSRCQIYPLQGEAFTEDLIGSESNYRHKVTKEMQLMVLQALVDLKYERSLPSLIAEAWKSYPVQDILYLLYLIIAHLIHLSTTQKQRSTVFSDIIEQLLPLENLNENLRFLTQITDTVKKISHNNINQVLLCEDLLICLSKLLKKEQAENYD